MNGDEVGKISKQWSGLAREMFTDADFFGISFPMDLDVRMKAVMLGACFLIVRHLFKYMEFISIHLNRCIFFSTRMQCSLKRPAIRNKTAQECFKLS